MKDLDFDELDRAVNSLMTGARETTSSDPKVGSTEKMLTINPTLSQDNKSSFSAAIEKSAAQAGQELEKPTGARAASPPAARRAGGRFMDVVHPSSDMKTVTRPVSREGVSLMPPSSRSVDVPKQPSEVPPTPAQPVSPSPSQPVPSPSMPVPTPIEEPVSKSDWPDPIALQDFEKEKTAATGTPMSPQTNNVSRNDSSTGDETAAEPLTTPFLSDTKVEKRPLGAFATDLHSKVHSPDGAAKAESTVALDQQNDEASKQLAADPIETLEQAQPELPAELHSELMKVESDQVSVPEVTSSPSQKPSAITTVTPAPEPTGPASISQQYREEPSTGDSEHAAIFDTDSYHQPLAHPAKHKSGWMMVVWIVLLLAVGAGGAAALYFSGII